MMQPTGTPTPKRKRVTILGTTGSIGQSTLKVIEAHSDKIEIAGVAARKDSKVLREILASHKIPALALSGEEFEETHPDFGPGQPEVFFGGPNALTQLVENTKPDILLVAVVGVAALQPTLKALELGIDVALASKEILVMAGPFVKAAAQKSGARLLPVDSEHNALFQCMGGGKVSQLEKMILTASGGPFRTWQKEDLIKVTPELALQHPNWDMGPKITIDSATMANKGLEVIEAFWLFDLPAEAIEVVIHPESIIHSMVQWKDGSVLAQMSPPDMRFAIQHCLFYPERVDAPCPSLDFRKEISLQLYPPNRDLFPCLDLAYLSLDRIENSAPAVFNAANEVAVDSFLKEEIPFIQIPTIIRQTMKECEDASPSNLKDLINLDKAARTLARKIILDKLT